jgi:Phage tail protein (Tail_P2_I)
MAKKPARERVWEISRIKGTPAAILGRIKAPDAESAIREWIEKFDITDPEQQSRLVARPVK